MTPGKAGGLLGERLKGATNTVSRLEAADFFLLPPSRGKVGMGVRCVSLCPPFTLRPPTLALPLTRGREILFATVAQSLPPRRRGSNLGESPAEPGVYHCELCDRIT